MKTSKQRMVWLGITAVGLMMLAGGCAIQPQVSPAWEWQQMSERYPNPPPPDPQPLGWTETRSYWQ